MQSTYLRALRMLYGFSLQHVSHETRIHSTTLSRLETRAVEPTWKQRATLTMFFGTSWDTLMAATATPRKHVDAEAIRKLLGDAA
jgi:transcriptional regulator with XRE-family HTH domain